MQQEKVINDVVSLFLFSRRSQQGVSPLVHASQSLEDVSGEQVMGNRVEVVELEFCPNVAHEHIASSPWIQAVRRQG